MTAYSLKTASKGCTAAVTLTITKAGDIHDNRAYILYLRKFCGKADRGRLAGQRREFKTYRKSTAQAVTAATLCSECSVRRDRAEWDGASIFIKLNPNFGKMDLGNLNALFF